MLTREEYFPHRYGPNGVVAANLLRLRAERGMSQKALREGLAEHGFTVSSLDMIRLGEQGMRKISVNELVAAAAVFGVEPVEMLTPPPGFEDGGPLGARGVEAGTVRSQNVALRQEMTAEFPGR